MRHRHFHTDLRCAVAAEFPEQDLPSDVICVEHEFGIYGGLAAMSDSVTNSATVSRDELLAAMG